MGDHFAIGVLCRFVGMLPQEQLQQFLVRAVTGFGERVQGKEVSEQDLADTTSAVRILAGKMFESYFV